MRGELTTLPRLPSWILGGREKWEKTGEQEQRRWERRGRGQIMQIRKEIMLARSLPGETILRGTLCNVTPWSRRSLITVLITAPLAAQLLADEPIMRRVTAERQPEIDRTRLYADRSRKKTLSSDESIYSLEKIILHATHVTPSSSTSLR